MSMLYLAALVMIEKIIENLTLHNDKVIFWVINVEIIRVAIATPLFCLKKYFN